MTGATASAPTAGTTAPTLAPAPAPTLAPAPAAAAGDATQKFWSTDSGKPKLKGASFAISLHV